MMKDIVISFFLLFGVGFFVVAGIGIVRFPDLYSRMHAASKASSLGLGLLLSGNVLFFLNVEVMIKSILTILFVFLTTPIAAHMLARTAYRAALRPRVQYMTDELDGLYGRHQDSD